LKTRTSVVAETPRGASNYLKTITSFFVAIYGSW